MSELSKIQVIMQIVIGPSGIVVGLRSEKEISRATSLAYYSQTESNKAEF